MKDNGNNDNKGQEDNSNKNNNDDANETEALMNQLDQLSITENKSFEDLISFQKNSSNILKFGQKELINNFYSNNQKPNQSEKDISNLNSINININDNNFTQNIELNDKKEILNLKLNNILTTLRLSDIKINIKYYGSLFRFKEYFEDDNLIVHYHSQFNDLFNIIIELLFIIKKEMEKNQMNSNKNNKNMFMKYQKEINLKNKQIETLLGKLKIEQQKFQKNSKDNNELIVLQKENKELLHQIDVYKNQIKKVDRNNKMLEEKLNNIILDKLHKRSSSVTNNINSISPSTPLSHNYENINFHETNTNKFSYKNHNKEYSLTQNIKRLNTNLINIVKDINEKLCTYDSSLNKPNDDDSQINAIKNLHKTNIIADFSKIDDLYKNFLSNRDKVLIKIYKLISDNTTINSQTIKKFESPSNKVYSNSDHKDHNEVAKSFINKADEKADSKIKVHKKFSSETKQ